MSLDALKTELAALEQEPPRYFKDWLAVADPETRELVLNAVHNNAIGVNKLATVLKGRGIPITRDTIERMRNDAR